LLKRTLLAQAALATVRVRWNGGWNPSLSHGLGVPDAVRLSIRHRGRNNITRSRIQVTRCRESDSEGGSPSPRTPSRSDTLHHPHCPFRGISPASGREYRGLCGYVCCRTPLKASQYNPQAGRQPRPIDRHCAGSRRAGRGRLRCRRRSREQGRRRSCRRYRAPPCGCR